MEAKFSRIGRKTIRAVSECMGWQQMPFEIRAKAVDTMLVKYQALISDCLMSAITHRDAAEDLLLLARKGEQDRLWLTFVEDSYQNLHNEKLQKWMLCNRTRIEDCMNKGYTFEEAVFKVKKLRYPKWFTIKKVVE